MFAFLFSRMIRTIALGGGLALILCALTELTAPALAQQQVSPLSIEYTGALFGYYRMEGDEIFTQPKLSAVKAFLEDPDHSAKRNLVLGMGDNFGPEFGASLQLPDVRGCEQSAAGPEQAIEDGVYGRDQPPVILYKGNTRVANEAKCDNVTRFLMAAGYRAVVPGREDFLYSSEWLRGIAADLRRASRRQETTNKEGALHLLAANLRIKAKNVCPLLFSDPEDAKKTVCVLSEGESVPAAQDWVERLDLTLDPRNGVAERIRYEAQGSIYIRRQALINQVGMTLSGLPPDVLKDSDFVKALTDLKKPEEYELRGADVLVKDKLDGQIEEANKKFCKVVLNSDLCGVLKELDRIFGALRSVGQQDQQDFLMSTSARMSVRNMCLRTIAGEEMDRGYTVTDLGGTDGTLLIGVVGPETMKAVSPTNIHFEQPREDTSKSKDDAGKAKKDADELKGDVYVLDPRRTVEIVLRAATLVADDSKRPITRVIVMAQMPRTEAEELGAHVREYLDKLVDTGEKPYRIDLILSEAQSEHASPWQAISYQPGALVPVLTPHPAFDYAAGGLVTPVSWAVLSPGVVANWTRSDPVRQRELAKALPGAGGNPCMEVPRPEGKQNPCTALGLFLHELNPAVDPRKRVGSDEAAIQYLLQRLQESSHADVVMLERRDLYLAALPDEYTGYEACDAWTYKTSSRLWTDPKRRCRLHVALDRVLWKGDLSERVMVTGKDLKSMLTAAQSQVKEQQSLAARDTIDQWLVTFGITTNDQQNLTRLEGSNNNLDNLQRKSGTSDRFSLPWSEACQGDTKQDIHYCVNGASIQEDAGYWVATSDHIAHDGVVYTAMSALPVDYHQLKRVNLRVAGGADKSAPIKDDREVFLTDELTKTLSEEKVVSAENRVAPLEKMSLTPLRAQQERQLAHLDYGKLVVGFNSRHPTGGNPAAAQLQGVTETRASQPTQQELDLESMSRASVDIHGASPAPSVSVGVQTDAEYDRAVIGNLTNKPINASYAANSFAVNGFLQKRIPFPGTAKTTHGNWANRELPRMLLVLTPHEYQQQLNGNYLFFPYMSPTNPTLSGELTVQAQKVTGFVDKAGLRLETAGGKRWWKPDPGSYTEGGEELGVQNNVLKSVTLSTLGQLSLPCIANSTKTIPQCFSAQKGFTIDSATTVSSLTFATLHASGTYWDVHLQKGLKGKDSEQVRVNLMLDTKGDFFYERRAGASLSTQTRYAFPLTASLNFPVLRNMSFSPTYSAFFYENQIARQSIIVNTFTISLKWYYDRDSAVPFGRMLLFKGPTSQDQTKTAKLK